MVKATFTMGELIQLRGTRQQPGSLVRLVQTKLPVKVAYRLGRAVTLVDREMKEFDAARNKIITELGTEKEGVGFIVEQEIPGPVDAEGKDTKIPNPNWVTFQAEMDKLLEEPVELEFAPVSLDQMETVEISTADIMSLDKFFEVVEPEAKK